MIKPAPEYDKLNEVERLMNADKLSVKDQAKLQKLY